MYWLRLIEGVKFAVGPTTAARKGVLEEIGGWDRLKDYLAEDFMLGALAAEKGHRMILSRYVVEHRIGSEPCAGISAIVCAGRARPAARAQPDMWASSSPTPSQSHYCYWRCDRTGGLSSRPPAFCAPPHGSHPPGPWNARETGCFSRSKTY